MSVSSVAMDGQGWKGPLMASSAPCLAAEETQGVRRLNDLPRLTESVNGRARV